MTRNLSRGAFVLFVSMTIGGELCLEAASDDDVHISREMETLWPEGGPGFLMYAVLEKSAPHLEASLRAGIKVNAADRGGRTALFVAVAQGSAEAVGALVAAGADVNAIDKNGRTPLMTAAASGQVAMVNQLLDCGAKISPPDSSGHTALSYAIGAECLPAVESLIARGADCLSACCDGMTPLAHAFETGDVRIFKTLLASQPRSLSWTQCTRAALDGAIRSRDAELLRLLIQKHPAPPSFAPGSQSAVAYAVAWGDLGLLRLLLDCGANPDVRLATPAEPEFVNLLPGKMLPYYVTTEPGMTPLMLAAALGRIECVQALLQHGAKRGAETAKYHLNALNFAAWTREVPAMLALLGRSPRLEEQPTRVEISLADQRASFFKNGSLALSTAISTGRAGFPTPTGKFVVTDKYLTRRSSLYKVEMPFFMRLNCSEFGMHAGVVPHYPASHGCIRMPRANAMKLFKEIEVGTLVMIEN